MDQRGNKFVTADAALEIILGNIRLKDTEITGIAHAFGRIACEDVSAVSNVPPFDNSAMDGYALRSEDTIHASKKQPVSLRIISELRAGSVQGDQMASPMTAIRIMTGAPIPKGADAVIPVEDTEMDSGGNVKLFRGLKKHENVRFAGEDMRAGETVLNRGMKLGSAEIGLLAAVNRDTISVYRKPRVAIISTGDEIGEVGVELQPGQIRNSNAYTLRCEVEKYGGIASYLGIARDEPEATRDIFAKALEHDIIISTGGVSLGKYDFVQEVVEGLGLEIAIQGVRIKPGRPMTFGTAGSTLFFGLPGNPVSTMVTFMQFVRPALLKMGGAQRIVKPTIPAFIKDAIIKRPGRREYIRGTYSIEKGHVVVKTTGPQGSGILRSMSHANCLIIVPEDVSEYKQGDCVIIQLIHHEEIM
jgi:molybdopterin molybdotransferase